MKISWIASALLIAQAPAALAQQPAVYPLRSQSAGQQSVDSGYCYWQAKRQTGVDMTRLSQRPERTRAVRFAADSGRGASEPPLPAAASASSGVQRQPKAAVTAAEAGGASSASDAAMRAARPDSASESGRAAQTSEQASGAPGSTAASASASGAANLPPLPPPPPPMTTYWQAYGDCMQGRGYGVQ
jgi:hypothetical protein